MLAAWVLLLGLFSGCGDGSDGDSGGPPPANLPAPPFINFHEDDFAENPGWRARGDDMVLLNLEHPTAAAGPSDTGTRGVDRIPVEYRDTAVRTFCWEGDPNAADDRAPHSMTLLDSAGTEVAYLEEDQPCISEVIVAGEYTLRVAHGGTGDAERDLVFVLPGWRAEFEAPQPGAGVEPATAASDEPPPPAASRCQTRSPFDGPDPGSGEVMFARSVIDRGEDSPGLPHILSGPCADVRLVTANVPGFPDGNEFIFGSMPTDTFVRVYREPDFRGPRIPIKVFIDEYIFFAHFVLEPKPVDPPAIGYIGSVAPEILTPDENLATVLRTNNCDHCNLQSVDLHGRDLTRVSLRGANLSHADLGGTTLNDAHAEDAFFQSANLRGAHLDRAHLDGANFESAGPIAFDKPDGYPAADLSEATLTAALLPDARMGGVTLTAATLTGAHLERADLTGATFGEATKRPADFSMAILDGATLTGVAGNDVIFTGAHLSGANLQGAILNGARMGDAVLQQAVLAREPGRLSACQLSGAYLANADLTSVEATGVNLRGARWYGTKAKATGAVLINADLDNAELSGTDFTGAQLANATFNGAKCVTSKFVGAHMAGTSSQTMDGAKFGGALLYGADFSQATISGCVFTDAILSFDSGTYIAGRAPDYPFLPRYNATMPGELTRAAQVICPDGLSGPCSSTSRLLPRSGTPTATVARTATPMPATPAAATSTPG